MPNIFLYIMIMMCCMKITTHVIVFSQLPPPTPEVTSWIEKPFIIIALVTISKRYIIVWCFRFSPREILASNGNEYFYSVCGGLYHQTVIYWPTAPMGWHNRLLVSEQTQPLLFLTKIEYRNMILYQNQHKTILKECYYLPKW